MTEMEDTVESKLHSLQAKVEESSENQLASLQIKVSQEVADLEKAIGASKALGDETKMRIDKGNENLEEMARILDETMKEVEEKKKLVDIQVNESKTKAMAAIKEFEAGVLEKQAIAKDGLEAEAGSVSNSTME